MAAIQSLEEEDAKRPSRERESLVGERMRLGNRVKSTLARLGIRGFKPNAVAFQLAGVVAQQVAGNWIVTEGASRMLDFGTIIKRYGFTHQWLSFPEIHHRRVRTADEPPPAWRQPAPTRRR
jgi:hypothetical protein